MILKQFVYRLFNKFDYFSEMLEPLKIYNPPMKNIVFLISQSALLLKHSLLFSKLIRQSHFCQFLSTFASLLDSILAPPDHFFDTHFRYLKKTSGFFFARCCVEGICDTSQIRGELGGALGGQGDHRRPRGVLEEKVAKTIVFFSKLARDPLFCLDETRATLTKYYKNQ